MKKMSKILAAVMAIVMIVAAIPMSAFAADYTISLGETITVTVPAEGYAECKFTPEADGKYVVYSDMGEADIDPYVDAYDKDGNLIASDDDNDYADIYDFYCIFEAEAGADYFFKMYAYEDYAVEFDVTVSVFGEITHQPTADEPYVEVSEGADAEYQWYKIGDSFAELTDEYATPREGMDEGEYATYDSANGWTGAVIDDYGDTKDYNFFTVLIPEGNTIKITADVALKTLGIWCVCGSVDKNWDNLEANDTVEFTADHTCFYKTWAKSAAVPHLKAEMPEMKKVNTDAELKAKEEGTHICIVTFDGCRYAISDEIDYAVPPEAIKLNETKSVTAPKDAYKELTFTPDADGKYVVYSDNGGNDDEIDPYVYVYDAFGNQIASDDDNDYTWSYNFCCEFEAVAGEVYYLQFCAYDDTVTYDVTVVNYAKISHQPTEAEPYVEIAPEAKASYQWFKVREGEVEITDKYIVDVAELDTVSTYSASKGWTPANKPAYYDADKDFYQFFWIYLEKGDKLTLDINGTVEEYICIESVDDYIEYDFSTSETNGSYTFEVEYTGVYMAYCYGEPGLTAKATVNGKYFEIIDGATDATLTPDEKSEYICMVTYDGDRYEFSDTVKITVIEHAVNVNNGKATKAAAIPGETITITANAAPKGKMFDKWVVEGATVADATKATTTFTMPDGDVTATATYKNLPVILSIEAPSVTKINYKDGIVLHATAENLPEGAVIVWSADNGNFNLADDGKGNLTATSAEKGDTVFTAKILLADKTIAKDEDGKEIQAEVTLNSNAGFFQKIFGFFKGLFGLLKVYDK